MEGGVLFDAYIKTMLEVDCSFRKIAKDLAHRRDGFSHWDDRGQGHLVSLLPRVLHALLILKGTKHSEVGHRHLQPA